MPEPDKYSHERYLRAKASITKRALSRRVWGRFIRYTNDISTDTVRILDVGGGVGQMALRLWDALTTPHIDYTLVDTSTEALRGAAATFDRSRMSGNADNTVFHSDSNQGQTMDVHLIEEDIFNYLRSIDSTEKYHVVVAQSILDLIPLRPFFQLVKPLLEGKSIIYSAETFNGKTTILPLFEDRGYEEQLIDTYHKSMSKESSEGTTSGSQAGKALFAVLQSEQARIVGAGSSDWIVYSNEGTYPQDEAYFLHHILHFFENELQDRRDVGQNQFRNWISTRRAQIEAGKLIYMAHQIDVLARFV